MAGRKTMGPALVTHLDGSASAKQRLELILATISGQVTVVAAAQQLGICEAMFYRLRNRVLQVSLEDLEPKPMGRPSLVPDAAAQRQLELEAQVAELECELQAQSIRLELAQTMPHLDQPPSAEAKKKSRQKRLKKFQSQRQARAKAGRRK